jgi:hypothetical protein
VEGLVVADPLADVWLKEREFPFWNGCIGCFKLLEVTIVVRFW